MIACMNVIGAQYSVWIIDIPPSWAILLFVFVGSWLMGLMFRLQCAFSLLCLFHFLFYLAILLMPNIYLHYIIIRHNNILFIHYMYVQKIQIVMVVS